MENDHSKKKTKYILIEFFVILHLLLVGFARGKTLIVIIRKIFTMGSLRFKFLNAILEMIFFMTCDIGDLCFVIKIFE